MNGNFKMAEEYSLKGYQIAEKLNDKTLLIQSYLSLGKLYVKLGELEKAENFLQNYLNTSLKEFANNLYDPNLAYPYYFLGICYEKKEEYVKSEEFYHQSLKIFKIVNGQNDMYSAYCYFGLGNIKKMQGFANKSEEFYDKSQKIVKKLGYDLQKADFLEYINLEREAAL